MEINDHTCHERKKCFAKGPNGGCSLLITTYPEEGMCKFCKPFMDITAGKIYPQNTGYIRGRT